MKAVIYARYSSHNQREESIEGQLRECQDFAMKNGFVVVDEYIDRAISGKTDNRPSFQRLIKDSEKGHFDAVIMYTLDRFARNRYDSAIYKAKLKKNGVRVFYAKQPMPDTPEGIILESVLEGYAEYYSENLARSIKRGLKENALHGIAMGSPCLGYKIGENRQYEIEPVGAKAVQEIFTMYAEGKSATQIVNWLNEQGYKTSRGNSFNKNSLSRILRNDKYIGVYRYDDVVIEDAVPPIISKSLFEKVQAMFKHNYASRARTKAKEDYLLSTKLFCGHCGEPMIGESGTSKTGKLHHYYKCAGRKRQHNCNKAVEKKELLETIVVKFTVQQVLTDENIEKIATKAMELIEKELEDTSVLIGLQGMLRECNKKIKNLMTAIEQGIITPTTKERLEELEEERRELEGKIAKEEMKKPLLSKERIMYWLTSFKSGDIQDVEYQRRIIDTLVNSIFVYDEDNGGRKIVLTFNVSGNNTLTISGSDIEGITPDADKQMSDFLNKLKSENLSCGGFYLSSGYTSIGNRRYVFNWNLDKFPNPKKFIEKFNENGIKIIPNIKPAFLDSHPLYSEIASKGLFVKNADGTPFLTEFWDGLGSYLDFTNPDAFFFWTEKVKETLLNLGITSTWNDNNEFDIKDITALVHGFGGGTVPASRIRPVLTYLMVAASYMAQIKKEPYLRPFLSTRSGNIAIRRLAQTWSGDNRSEFSDLRFCHNIGLTMSLSGLYFYGHDLGGFDGDMPSRELLLRWLQHGVFEPRFTIHSWNKDGSATMPWSYPDISDAVHRIFAQRKKLTPYLYNCAYNAVEKEIPLNAPPLLYYDDEELVAVNNSMMVGTDILVSFVFEENKDTVKVYLPKNENWYLGEKFYPGGQTVELHISSKAEIPYFVRSGCVLPYDEGEYDFNCDEDIVFTVYPVNEGSFESTFFTDDGLTFAYKMNECVDLHFVVNCTKDKVTVIYKNKGKMPFEVKIRLCDADKRILEVEND